MNGEVATNKATITVITTGLVLMAFACVVTICLLAYWKIQIPPELNTLAGTLCGGVAGMLVKTSPTESTRQVTVPPIHSGDVPTEVKVVNVPTDPVPTTTEGAT
jgi:hypothetical protein